MDPAPKDIPAHDAPDESFVFPDPDLKDAALLWAQGVLADLVHYHADVVTRACRVVLANSTSHEHRQLAEWLLSIGQKQGVGHAA